MTTSQKKPHLFADHLKEGIRLPAYYLNIIRETDSTTKPHIIQYLSTFDAVVESTHLCT